ncbi:type 4 pilus major pilin [Achromobacter aloeverae]|uniref:Prepilin-type cleavage/methylation domain-containing protein n=1 Tax=Achromobacter aloeverae TaxID=1750518 RepID=A0A4Q1HR72_9BURK|nr:type 4 pilus major pilin [Achromobacter aloeverae]RXN93489.1 prepilin-type cleavage/methylation domain-containing protein [Achromobacter aloeverae]
MNHAPLHAPLHAPVRHARLRPADGFSLIEVSIVTAIVLLIAIIGVPALGTFVIENKVPKVGEALQRYITHAKTNAQGSGPTPYAGVHTGLLAQALRGSSVIAVTGEGVSASVAHGLGGKGRAGHGTLTLAPAAVGEGGAGSAFTLTATHVNDAACPTLAAVMQRMADIIAVEGKGGRVVVKDATRIPAQPYDPARAQEQCSAGDANTFVFTVR